MSRTQAISRTLFPEDLVSELYPGRTLYVDGTEGSNGNDAFSWESAKATITAALAIAEARDRILIAPGGYNETVLADVEAVKFIGAGPRGSVYIEPETAGAEGMQVTADDVTLLNLGVAGDAAADYALNVKAAARFRAYQSKFEGPDGTVVLLDGTADDQAADALLDDCEFAWGGAGVVFDDSAYGYPTQVRIQRSLFHNIVTKCVGVNASGLVKNLQLLKNIFDNQEDGTAPTDYLLLSDNGNTGLIAGNYFATATNATGVLTIGTGLKWGPNGTEAGWSTARPA